MSKNNLDKVRLFTTGFLQVSLVSLNTYLITKVFYLGILLVSFMISFIWSYNIRKVAFGTLQDRVVYSLGASIGALLGVFLGTVFI